MTYTYEEIAGDFDLWRSFIDPDGVMAAEEFHGMGITDRVGLIEEMFGPEGNDA
jgi:hypothetical protein